MTLCFKSDSKAVDIPEYTIFWKILNISQTTYLLEALCEILELIPEYSLFRL